MYLNCTLNLPLQTPLHLATHTQQTEMIRKLLMAGASPYLTDHKGNTPMHIACKLNTTKCLDEILRYTTLRNIRQIAQLRNNEGLSCVHVAVRHGNTDVLRKLRSMGVDLNMKVGLFTFCSQVECPLHCRQTCTWGKCSSLSLLLMNVEGVYLMCI